MVKMAYLENWFVLGVCIYSRKTADAALAALGLRKAIKRRTMRPDIDVNTLIALRDEGLSIREIAAECKASYTFVRNRLIAADINLERRKR